MALGRPAPVRGGPVLDGAERDGRPWQVAWCAGAGVAGTSDDDLAAEVGALRVLLGAVGGAARPFPRRWPSTARSFVASSVGGVYGGTPIRRSPRITRWRRCRTTAGPSWTAKPSPTPSPRHRGCPTVIGRITNLYGPGQNLDKPQGLISHLCWAHLTRHSVSVYVSLDTIRDYLFVDDCAGLVLDALDRVRRRSPSPARCGGQDPGCAPGRHHRGPAR